MPFVDVRKKHDRDLIVRMPSNMIRIEVPTELTAEEAHTRCKNLRGFRGINKFGDMLELVFNADSDKKDHKIADRLVRRAGHM